MPKRGVSKVMLLHETRNLSLALLCALGYLCDIKQWTLICRVVFHKKVYFYAVNGDMRALTCISYMDFCVLTRGFNTTFLNKSALCLFCWSWTPVCEVNVSNIHIRDFSHNSKQYKGMKFYKSMDRNLCSSKVSDISASELLTRGDLSRQSAQ